MPIIEVLAKEAARVLINRLGMMDISLFAKPDEVLVKVEEHLTFAVNWSRRGDFFGATKGVGTDAQTVPLAMDTVPRKFRGNAEPCNPISEDDLLSMHEHFLILGDPGAGKTTTIRRLVRRILTTTAENSLEIWQYPIVLPLRLCDLKKSVVQLIADACGITYEHRADIAGAQVGSSSLHDDPRDRQLYVGRELLELALPKALDSSAALIFVDGLDEVSRTDRDRLWSGLQRLGQRLGTAKIIASCRSGDYEHQLEGFDIVELQSLDDEQVTSIAHRYLDDEAERFEAAVANSPIRDLTHRPLFLAQLLVIFRNEGNLPTKPKAIYQRIIELLLVEWERGPRNHGESVGKIRRESRYAAFQREEKESFLAALSYELIWRNPRPDTRFTTERLVAAYDAIHESFELPPGEARLVAQELETHTGLIVESGTDHFEFSHLSLQEYLCADHLVRNPFTMQNIELMQSYPAPIAVAVALSGDPSRWLAKAVLSERAFVGLTFASLDSLLSRLVQERPSFSRCNELGYAILRLLFAFKVMESKYIALFLELPHIASSISDALKNYMSAKDGFLTYAGKFDIDFPPPKSGFVPDWLLAQIAEKAATDRLEFGLH